MAWQAWERVARSSWTVTMPPGLDVELRPHDPVTSGVLYCGLPDWAEMRFVLDYLRPNETMVDVGANVGLYSLLAASVEGVRVVAFEPDPGARDVASANIVRNGMSDRIDLRPHAVGSVEGMGHFTVGLGPTNHLVAELEQGNTIRAVDIVTLDATVPGSISLLKVDVEGQEPAVLAGAARLLMAWRPALILEANDPSVLTAFLEPLGYSWVDYDPDQRRLMAAPRLPAPRSNGIAVADVDDATARVGRSR
jgi:FkbM family methyltransferase